MTREQLESYRSMKEEITELKYKLDHFGEGDALIGNDVIMDYRSGYPVPQSVVGYDFERGRHLREMYKRRKAKLEKTCAELEAAVEEIPDSLTRRIFRMYFLDCLPQEKVAKMVHLSQSSVSKKISEFFKLE